MKTRVPEEFWDLRLYVSGRTSKSNAVLQKLKATCETHLEGRYRITVIDLVKQPERASADQILAVPTVLRRMPKPARWFVGNLSDASRLLLDVLPSSSD